MEVAIALLLSVLVNFWQFNTTGELKAERDNYEQIASQCITNREEERRATLDAADAREATEEAMGRELSRQEQHTRNAIKNANDTCLDSGFVLGSKLYDREKQTTDRLNSIWMQGPSEFND